MRGALALGVVLLGLAMCGQYQREQSARTALSMVHRLDQRVAFPTGVAHECRSGEPLLRLLVLGQSNAANHGELDTAPSAVDLLAGTRCIRASDPLPGATGRGGSVWAKLEVAWAELGLPHRLQLSILAVDATSSADWTTDGPLRTALFEHARLMLKAGTLPHFVLWQQGEADARQGVDEQTYKRNLQLLAHDLAQAGVDAPVVLARSTLCRSAPSNEIRAAIESLASSDPRFRLGPDIDDLAGPTYRHDGCHLSIAGRKAAAARWAAVLGRLAG